MPTGGVPPTGRKHDDQITSLPYPLEGPENRKEEKRGALEPGCLGWNVLKPSNPRSSGAGGLSKSDQFKHFHVLYCTELHTKMERKHNLPEDPFPGTH